MTSTNNDMQSDTEPEPVDSPAQSVVRNRTQASKKSCPLCNRSFARNEHLQRHVKTRTHIMTRHVILPMLTVRGRSGIPRLPMFDMFSIIHAKGLREPSRTEISPSFCTERKSMVARHGQCQSGFDQQEDYCRCIVFCLKCSGGRSWSFG